MSRLVGHLAPKRIDAVIVTHGHADRCADLNPVVRARHLADDPPAALAIYAPAGALDALLALDVRASTITDSSHVPPWCPPTTQHR